MAYELIEGGDKQIRAWIKGVPMEDSAKVQLRYTSMVPCVAAIAVMPDCHFGVGCCVGSVVATKQAIIPSTVGVDLGCGIMTVRTTLTSHQLSDNAKEIFEAISRDVPHGAEKGKETGNWECNKNSRTPDNVKQAWEKIHPAYRRLIDKHGQVSSRNAATQLGSLGSGNHFIEVCLDEQDRVWICLHSGSRGAGNRIGQYYIELAKKEMERLGVKLPDQNLGYLQEGTQHFDDYVEAVSWAQDYARINRELMMENTIKAIRHKLKLKVELTDEAVNIHHNYVQKERHFEEDLYITRKGATAAAKGMLGVIPGSMGAKTFIVRGKGNPDSFESCSHGAGRIMSRTVAKNSISQEQHLKDTEGVVCRKDRGVIDESPRAYKNIDDVMTAQEDLVEVVHTLKQVVCVKG